MKNIEIVLERKTAVIVKSWHHAFLCKILWLLWNTEYVWKMKRQKIYYVRCVFEFLIATLNAGMLVLQVYLVLNYLGFVVVYVQNSFFYGNTDKSFMKHFWGQILFYWLWMRTNLLNKVRYRERTQWLKLTLFSNWKKKTLSIYPVSSQLSEKKTNLFR